MVFDSQIENAVITEIKYPLSEALRNHDSGCELMNEIEQKEFVLNNSTLYDTAIQVYDTIYQKNKESEEIYI